MLYACTIPVIQAAEYQSKLNTLDLPVSMPKFGIERIAR